MNRQRVNVDNSDCFVFCKPHREDGIKILQGPKGVIGLLPMKTNKLKTNESFIRKTKDSVVRFSGNISIINDNVTEESYHGSKGNNSDDL